MKRVLFVAYYFPPLGGIGSIRTVSFAEHLSDFGWEATVLAPRNGAYHRDPGLAFPETRVIRTGSIELSRAGKQLLRTGGSDTEAASVHGVRQLLKHAVRRHAYFPDAQIGWYLPAVIRAQQEIRPGRFDAIFSSSFPVTAHLIARTLRRRLHVPWVAEFRDPWCARLAQAGTPSRRAERLERGLAQEADALVTVSPSWGQIFGAAWQRDVSVITNGHDGNTTAAPAPLTDRFTLGYAGTFYPESQDLDAIWSAAAALDQMLPGVDAIRVIGNRDEALEARVAACGAGGLLEFTGYLPHAEVAPELARCTALVVPGPLRSTGIERGWIVAKLFEYLATSRPIIYVGDPETDAAQLLRGFSGTHIVATGDTAAALAALRTARTEVVVRDASRLSRRALTGGLAGLLDEACS
jgi:glycosyltransferase involved in cell wall biosynthesis